MTWSPSIAEATPKPEVLTPERVHELFGLQPPYKPEKAPRDWPGCVTFWDPGRSIADIYKRFRPMFAPTDWFTKLAFGQQSVLAQWRRLRIEPIGPGKLFVDQKVPKGDEIPSARTVLTLTAIRFALTGERWPLIRLRTRDVLPNGRILVQSSDLGVVIWSYRDTWVSPTVALASISPVVTKA